VRAEVRQLLSSLAHPGWDWSSGAGLCPGVHMCHVLLQQDGESYCPAADVESVLRLYGLLNGSTRS
jgi:hypothetical protein